MATEDKEKKTDDPAAQVAASASLDLGDVPKNAVCRNCGSSLERVAIPVGQVGDTHVVDRCSVCGADHEVS